MIVALQRQARLREILVVKGHADNYALIDERHEGDHSMKVTSETVKATKNCLLIA